MFRKLCKRHRNTFPHICAIVLLIIALVPLYVLEKRGKPVELWYISSIFAIAFALFCYGITAPSAMKKAPVRKQLTALSQDFFGMMWPFSYFYTPKPLHELYPPEPPTAHLAESLSEQHPESPSVPLCDVTPPATATGAWIYAYKKEMS